MRAILCVISLLILAPRAQADVGTPDEPSNQTTGAIAIGTSIGASMLNLTTTVGKMPSYWTGGIGIGLGVGALALTAAEDPAYENGLWAAGVASITTGLMALRYRYVLNLRENHACIAPVWADGPGLALVIDF